MMRFSWETDFRPAGGLSPLRNGSPAASTSIAAAKAPVYLEAEGFTLRTIESVGVKYEILWDGEVLNRYPNLKTAETFFMDFAGITKAKYKKIKNAA